MSSVLTPGNISWTKFTSIASERSSFKTLRFPHRRSLKTSFIQNWLLVFSVVGVILFPNRLHLGFSSASCLQSQPYMAKSVLGNDETREVSVANNAVQAFVPQDDKP
jgi:hypothetical protein